jgi:hypothetical protein
VLLDFDSDGDIDLALSDEIADVVVLMQNSNGPNALCPPAPATCRTTVQAGKSSLQLKDKTPDTGLIDGKAKIVFKGKGGPLAMPAPTSFAGPVAVRLTATATRRSPISRRAG